MATSPITDPMEGMPDGEAMDDGELASILAQHELRSVGYFSNEIADEQAAAIDYYYGRPFGDEVAGRSQVVDRTVAVVIDNALAALLKPFVSAKNVVSFEARGPEDEKVADQATEYVNYCFQCDNPGFSILHDWFKGRAIEQHVDALHLAKILRHTTAHGVLSPAKCHGLGLTDALKILPKAMDEVRSAVINRVFECRQVSPI